MRYSSTRGRDNKRKFDEIACAGLASDGGLYEPIGWPSQRTLRKLLSNNASSSASPGVSLGVSLGDVVAEVLRLFAAPSFTDIDFKEIAHSAFNDFNSTATTPLREVEHDLWLLELFHGPTLSFKDLPLQVYGRLLESIVARRKRLLIMIGATSGDTGSAAIAALKPIRGLRLFMLHPRDRISELQRRQMTCNQMPHICNIAVDGSYDDCLRLAKAMFSSEEIQARGELGAVNSFNWVRIAVQAAVYIYAANRLPQKYKKVRFALASGNFGNAYAGYVAKMLGAPIESIELAVSKNDCLHNFFETGNVKVADVVPSLTPSIDIMTPNNLERFIFRLLGASPRRWRKLLDRAKNDKGVSVPKHFMRKDIFKFFHSFRFDDEQTLEAMVQAYHSLGDALDPHSAIALAAAKRARIMDATNKRKRSGGIATITFATASAAKFPDTVERAIGTLPHIPLRLGELKDKQELYETIPAEETRLEELIIKQLRTTLDSDQEDVGRKEEIANRSYVVSAPNEMQSTTGSTEGEEAIPAREMASKAPPQQETTTGYMPAEEVAIGEGSIGESLAGKIPAETTSMEGRPVTETSDQAFATMPPIGVQGTTPSTGFSPALDTTLFPKTASEESLEQKIEKLKERTTQLEETLDTSALESTSDSEFGMPPTPSPTTDSTIFSHPLGTESSAQTETLNQSTQGDTEQGSTQETPFNEPTSSAGEDLPLEKSPSQSPSQSLGQSLGQYVAASVSVNKSDGGIENLAQAAEEGQASLESKIAKLKEQSVLLDDAAEQTKRSFDQSDVTALSAIPDETTSDSTSDLSAFPTEEPSEKQDEPSIAGASPFFNSDKPSDTHAEEQTTAEQSLDNDEQKDETQESKREDGF